MIKYIDSMPFWVYMDVFDAYINKLCGIQRKPTQKQHIWFLPKRKTNSEKPKELFFANALIAKRKNSILKCTLDKNNINEVYRLICRTWGIS